MVGTNPADNDPTTPKQLASTDTGQRVASPGDTSALGGSVTTAPDLRALAALFGTDRFQRAVESIRTALAGVVMNDADVDDRVPLLPLRATDADMRQRIWDESDRFVSHDSFGAARVDLDELATFMADLVNEHAEDLGYQITMLENELADAHDEIDQLTHTVNDYERGER